MRQKPGFLKDFRTIGGRAGVQKVGVEIDDLGAFFLPKLWGLRGHGSRLTR
jgi:hypothetical protein